MKWHDGQPVTAEAVKFSFEATTGGEALIYKPFGANIASIVIEGEDRHWSPPCRCPMPIKATPRCPSGAAHRIRATRRQAACSATAAQRPMPAAPPRSRN